MAIDLFFVTTILATTIFLSTPIAFTFSGVMWAELSGVFVFGIEGSMLMSAVAGFLGTIATGNIVIGFLLGLGTGVVMGLLTAFFEVTLGADQVIFAIALLVLGPSLSSYLFDSYVALHSLSAFSTTIGTLPAIPVPYLSDIPLLGEFFKQSLLVYVMYVLVILTYVFFFYTKAGLRVRAAGMDPMAAETQGINVNRIRIIAVIISAILAALGGMTMILAQTGFWADNITAGRGLLAIALVRVGNWKTPVVLASTFVVGFLFAISSYLQQYYAGTATAAFPYEIFNDLPYVFAIAIIAISYKWTRSNQPTAIGLPYRRE
jgi:simple sugar transport system permease protein